MRLLPRRRTTQPGEDQGNQDTDQEPGDQTDAEAPRRSRSGWFSGARSTARRASAAAGPWPAKGTAATKGFLALALAAMACGPAALALAATRPPTTTAASATPTGGDTGQMRTAVEATSVQLVHALLTADQEHSDHLKTLMAEPPGSLSLPAKALEAPTTITVDSIVPDPATAHRWRATVLALGGQSGDGQTWQVDVDVNPATGVARALRLPAQITTTQPPRTDDSDSKTSIPAGDQSAVTGFGYVTALLTGASDLSRWTAPGSSAAPITPAACQKVAAEKAEIPGTDQAPAPTDGQHLSMTVTVTCTLPTTDKDTTNVRSLQYPLTLASRGGRWEVTTTTTTTPTPSPTTTSAPTPSARHS